MAGVTEAQSNKQLEWLIEETSAGMAVYDVSEEIHKLALERNDLHTAMLADNAFWRVHLGALQNALFGSLGRIFDESPTYTANLCPIHCGRAASHSTTHHHSAQ
jgi:hypothetical protein